MKATITRILIIVNAIGWNAVLLAALSPTHLLTATACSVDIAVVGYCIWTLAGMFRRRG